MAINTNALTLGSSMPANGTYPSRTNGAGAGAGQVGDPSMDSEQNSQPDNATNPAGPDGTGGAGSGSTGAGAVNGPARHGGGPSTAAGGSTVSGKKTAGPSAQTRNAQASQTGSARTNTAGAAGNPANTVAQDAAQESATDFGSVMASALGRSSAGTAGGTAAKSAADATDSSASTTPGQPATGTPADAVAWIAQVLVPAATPQPATVSAPGTAALHAEDENDGNVDPTTALTSGGAQGPGTQSARLALTAQPSASTASALQAQINGSTSTSQNAQASDVQTAASAVSAGTIGNVNALADVQKLISGLSSASSADTDADTGTAAPATHATLVGSSTDAAQAAAVLQSAAPTGSLAGITLTIHAPVGSAAFADEVGTQAVSLAQSGITQAQLQLSPADMGPVQVHITLQAGQASVWFGATHADTRAALEQSLPQLRELFAGAGMPLTDSGVFREAPQQQPSQSQTTSGTSRTSIGDTTSDATVTHVANVRLSLLDTYA